MGWGARKISRMRSAFLKKAFRSGGDDAAYQLGLFYEGALQDVEKALYWHRRAAVLGHLDAQYRINALSHQGDGLAEQHLWLAVTAMRKMAMPARGISWRGIT